MHKATGKASDAKCEGFCVCEANVQQSHDSAGRTKSANPPTYGSFARAKAT